ncbi:RNA polymerase sigma factor [Kitasatospora sp. NPDC059146]|uniref:RNA polymerase sigma factor n=1 Tax=Kitasatospora sp. NPDC059146 TaxID=3346741 RepID=UPI0036CDFE2E
MSESPFADAAGTAPRVELPITLIGFQELHAEPYFQYTLTNLGDQNLAQRLVSEVFLRLGECWDQVLNKPNPAAYAWAALRHAVEAERARRDEHLALVERVAFSVALRLEAEPLLHDLSASVANLEKGITLGAAILELSGAKFDVVVLRYINGLTIARTARAMGVDEATVRSLTSQARSKIEARLKPRRVLRPGPATHDQE